MALPDIDLSFLGNIDFGEGPARIVRNLAALGLTAIGVFVAFQMLGFNPKEYPISTLHLAPNCYTLIDGRFTEIVKGLAHPLNPNLRCLGSFKISDSYSEPDKYVDLMSFHEERLKGNVGLGFVVESVIGDVQYTKDGKPTGIKNSLVTQRRADLNKIIPPRGGIYGFTPDFKRNVVDKFEVPHPYLITVTPGVAMTYTPTPTRTATPGPSPTPTLTAFGEIQKNIGEGADEAGKFIQSLIPWALGLAGTVAAGAVALAGARLKTKQNEAEKAKEQRRQNAYAEALTKLDNRHKVRVDNPDGTVSFGITNSAIYRKEKQAILRRMSKK